MNQILATKPVRQKKPTNIKTVQVFFAISIIIFGICLITSGSYAMYKSMSLKNTGASKTLSSEQTTQEYTPVEDDNSQIQIELSSEGTNVLASINGEKEISFVTYKWDDEEENRKDIGGVSGEITIEIPKGEHKLSVTAVDINNNSSTKTITVKGVTRPTIDLTRNGLELYIHVSDELGLKEIELSLNGEEPVVIDAQGAKEKNFKCPLQDGENKLKVIAHNTEGYTETFENSF